jgi:hypothetical protein
MSKRVAVLAAILAARLIVPMRNATAQQARDTAPRDTVARVLYRSLPYGSQANFSPLSVLLNKGFDHFQARNARRDVWTFPYGNALRYGVWDALRHPAAAIERSPGWSTWMRTEVLPLSFNSRDAAWVVNYTEHLVAGGLTYRMLGEWYAEHHVPFPRAWAAATTFAAAALNEAAEFPTATRAAASSVADLYIFDIGGILLFNWNPLVRVFGERLQAADWSNQATFTAPDGVLRNTGQYMIYKIPLPAEQWRLFVRGGMGAQFGLSRQWSRGLAITAALGMDTQVRLVDPVTRSESIRLAPGGGLYVDRHNSLLASLTAGPSIQRLTLNIYPGVLTGHLRDLGVWSGVTADGRVVAGVIHRRTLGVGVGYGPRS